MTLTDLLNDVTFLTGGVNTVDYTTADRIRNINNYYQKVVTMILSSQDEWDFDDANYSDFPLATTDLKAGQQDYAIDATLKFLRMKRVEITYDGTNWHDATPLDIGERGKQTDTTTIASDFSTGKPFYDTQYGSIFLYPIPQTDIDEGLKMWFYREPITFTAATADLGLEPGFDEPFHRMLSVGASLDWEVSRKPEGARAKQLLAMLNDYEIRLRNYYGQKQGDRNYILKSSYIDYN